MTMACTADDRAENSISADPTITCSDYCCVLLLTWAVICGLAKVCRICI